MSETQKTPATPEPNGGTKVIAFIILAAVFGAMYWAFSSL